MKRLWILAAALVALVQAQPSHAETQTWFGFQVGISGGSPAPPPYMFRTEPRVVVVNNVYVVDDMVYSAVVVMVAVTTILTPPLLVWRMRGRKA